MHKERVRSCIPGGAMLITLLGVIAMSVWATIGLPRLAPVWIPSGALAFIGLYGLFIVKPNEAKVIQLFGRYVGTVKTAGLMWANPFYSKRGISQRARTFQSAHLKVNDLDGNPIQIAAVIVWRVVDTAKASFDVDDFRQYVEVQSEAALRDLTSRYPYDSDDEEEISLRGHTLTIANHLRQEVQDKATTAGVEILDARISHLAYAPEIAHAMLQRQQASAVIAARQRIVEGAVGMVELALQQLSQNEMVDLDESHKAQMVCNLLVVLCSDRSAQPVVPMVAD